MNIQRFLRPAAFLLASAIVTNSHQSLEAKSPPTGRRMLTLGRLISHANPSGTAAEPPAGQASVPEKQDDAGRGRGGLTFENLWDRWQTNRTTRKSAPSQSAADPEKSASQRPTDSQPAELLEAPQPVRPAGEFPAFRVSGNQPTNAAATAPTTTELPQPAPRPEPVERPQQMHVETTTAPSVLPAGREAAVRINHEAEIATPAGKHVAKVTIRPATDAIQVEKPTTAPGPNLRSTSAYLNDRVRFGAVVRRPVSAAPAQATPVVRTEPVKAATSPLRPAERPASETRPAFDAVFVDEPGVRPEVLEVQADDPEPLHTRLPQASATLPQRAFDLQPGATDEVSPAASPAALQRALHDYGAQSGRAAPSPPPAPQAPPAPEPQHPEPQQIEQPASPRFPSAQSILPRNKRFFSIDEPAPTAGNGITEPPARQNQALSGSVAGVDKANRTILVIFPGQPLPPEGSKVQVFQKIIFKRQLLAEFEVVGVQGQAVVARPIGKLDMDLILNGDEAISR